MHWYQTLLQPSLQARTRVQKVDVSALANRRNRSFYLFEGMGINSRDAAGPVQRSNDATHRLLKAGHVRVEDMPPVETMRDEAADCLQRHFVTVTAAEEARRREFDARLAAATGRT
jgi:hypothetical protein